MEDYIRRISPTPHLAQSFATKLQNLPLDSFHQEETALTQRLSDLKETHQNHLFALQTELCKIEDAKVKFTQSDGAQSCLLDRLRHGHAKQMQNCFKIE